MTQLTKVQLKTVRENAKKNVHDLYYNNGDTKHRMGLNRIRDKEQLRKHIKETTEEFIKKGGKVKLYDTNGTRVKEQGDIIND